MDPDHTKSKLALRRSKLLLSKKEEGNVAFRCGQLERALELYSEALAVDPRNTFTNSKLHCNRALVESKVGQGCGWAYNGCHGCSLVAAGPGARGHC